MLLALVLLAQLVPSQPAPAVNADSALVPSQADAPVKPPAPTAALMDTELRTYFAGEKHEAYAWLGVGAAMAGGGTYFALREERFSHGLAIPMLAVSAIQLGAAAVLFYRTDEQVTALSAELAKDPRRYVGEEGGRMAKVNRGFDVYKWVELGCFGSGLVMSGVGGAINKDLLLGAGIGLVAQSVAMLLFDHFAEQRARLYDRQIQDFGETLR